MLTKTKTVWLIEAMSYDTAWAKLNKLWLEDGIIDVLASDGSLEECYAIVSGDYNKISNCGFKIMIPDAGVFIDSCGAEVFVDNNQQVVKSAEEVVESLNLDDEDLEAYTSCYITAYELLEKLGRIF